MITSPWDLIDGKTILSAMERKDSLQAELDRLAKEVEHAHEHHHHHHDEECDDENCCCHHHEHEHHHHHADEVFTSWGVETTRKYTQEELVSALKALEDEEKYGKVLRAKGIVASTEKWLHFDYVPCEADIRFGGAGVIGRLCVIGCGLNEDALKQLFQL